MVVELRRDAGAHVAAAADARIEITDVLEAHRHEDFGGQRAGGYDNLVVVLGGLAGWQAELSHPESGARPAQGGMR